MTSAARASHRLDPEAADMIRKPRAPCHVDLRAGLQDRRHPAGRAAGHHAHVTALAMGEDLQDRRRLSVAANGKQDPSSRHSMADYRRRPALSMRRGHGRVRAMFPVLSRAARLQALDHRRAGAASVVAAMGLPDGPARDRAA
jgi:hypothetical protein